MTDRELMQQALEALGADDSKLWPSDKRTEAIRALKERLAQPEQDQKPPVKTYCGGKPNYCTPEQETVAWRPIESAPKTGRKVILFYKNRLNVGKTVIARCLTDEQATEIDADDVGLEGGWYECIDNWGDFTDVVIHEGEPSHWMPLPAPPIEALRQALETEREWVGLADDEAFKILDNVLGFNTSFGLETNFVRASARAIEAKLREKNT